MNVRAIGLAVVVAVIGAGCSSDTGAREGIDRVLALGSPLIEEASVRGDFLSGDEAYVYIANDSDDADARLVWCEVMIPSGLSEGKVRVVLATLDERYLWYMPQDCSDPGEVPERQTYS